NSPRSSLRQSTWPSTPHKTTNPTSQLNSGQSRCHNPGEFVGHAANLTEHHQNLGFYQITSVVDRAYNYERIETFHLPMARLGVELVFDYKAEDLGLQSHFSDLILVDGSWYVNWMPTSLIEASRKVAATEVARDEAKIIVYKTEHPTKRKGPSLEDVQTAIKILAESEEALPSLQQNIDAREPYRMIPKGRRDVDGFQRFSYPPLNKMLAQPKVAPSVSSVTIPPTLPINETVASGKQSGRKPRTEDPSAAHSKRQAIKFGQHLPHKTVEWRRQYGMRSLVESSNNLLKTDAHGDIGNPKKRSGRGYAALYITLAFSVVTSNLRRIATFFKAEAHRLEDANSGSAVKHRTRRRHDALGAPLVRSHDGNPPGPTT
ncbi:hypothetical protein, partial [Frigoribacterium sp. UYMn621]|uniref:hypothetical protein n=1 Tax=Frigoribacterium sp. UYMn621 TaxID=3156343 RepID=UPI00339AB5F1